MGEIEVSFAQVPTQIKPEWFDDDDHRVLKIFEKLALTYRCPYRTMEKDKASA